MSRIGFQNGIEAARQRMKKLDPGGFKPDGSGAWDKFFRTFSHLVVEHDQKFPPAPPPPPPPPPTVLVAPKTVNTEGSSDQRFSMRVNGSLRPGVSIRGDGLYTDQSGALYARDGGGLEESGVRNKDIIPGLVGAKSMDGRSADECPTVGDPAKNTGSWKV